MGAGPEGGHSGGDCNSASALGPGTATHAGRGKGTGAEGHACAGRGKGMGAGGVGGTNAGGMGRKGGCRVECDIALSQNATARI